MFYVTFLTFCYIVENLDNLKDQNTTTSSLQMLSLRVNVVVELLRQLDFPPRLLLRYKILREKFS